MSQFPDNNPFDSKPIPEKPDAWGEPPRTSGKAIASLILSLFSLFFCGIPGIIALFLGFQSHGDIRRSNGRLTGGGFATSGIVIAFTSFAMLILVMPILLLLPAINAAREAARRNGCLSNVRQLSIASLNHESATMRFPLGTDAVGPYVGEGAAQPGSTDGDLAAGYSWQVKLLPYFEESILYDEIRRSSEKFETAAFDPTISSSYNQHPSLIRVPSLRCPSFAGESFATAPEYAGIGDVALGNYVGVPGTHVKADGTLDENGVFVSAASQPEPKGLKIGELGDGISKTIIIAESSEQAYASWYDGQATWVTALKTDVNETQFTQAADGFPKAPSGSAALQFGPDDGVYFPAGRFAGQQSREWGPSSHHGGGVVLHAFADAHASSISRDVDATLYMRMVTRNSGEPADLFELGY